MIVEPEAISIFDHSERVRDQYITVDGYRTHYLEAGPADAPPLVLVHGGACEIGMGVDRWYPTILPLAEQFRVFAVDELGHGYTDPPRNFEDLAHVRVRAEHVISFIEALGVGPVCLLGQSQGGWIVAYVALTRPQLVRKLVLVDSGSASGSSVRPGGLPFFKNVFEPGTQIPKHDLTTRAGIHAYVSEFCYDRSRINEPMLDRLMALSQRWNPMYMRHARWFWDSNGRQRRLAEYSYNGRHINESLHEIAVPTLVVWGKQSNKGLDAGVELYARIPDAQMHIFDKANHFVWLDQPQGFNGLVTWYLRE